jgi:hypothetical protein
MKDPKEKREQNLHFEFKMMYCAFPVREKTRIILYYRENLTFKPVVIAGHH